MHLCLIDWGVHLPLVSIDLPLHCYFLIYSYKLTFKRALIDDIEQQRVHSVLWQFQMGGQSAFGIYRAAIALLFSYIFL